MKNIVYVFVILIFMILISCNNNQNKMIGWADNIPIGTDLITVKNNQPDFLEIDWEKPDTFENETTRYFITKIKWNYDVLKMGYYLEFENNKYRGCFGRK